jgi:hypothetical protein
MTGPDFGDQKYALTLARNYVVDQSLGVAVAIYLLSPLCRLTSCQVKGLCAALPPQRLPDVFPVLDTQSPDRAPGRWCYQEISPFALGYLKALQWQEPMHSITPQLLRWRRGAMSPVPRIVHQFHAGSATAYPYLPS